MSTIVITAGHGGNDVGAVNPRTGHHEAKLMVQLRNVLAICLRDLGHEVIADGNGLENKTLKEAIRLIPNGAVAIELHTNASTNRMAAGVEVIGLARHKALCQKLALAINQTMAIPIRRDAGWWEYAKTGRTLGFCGAGGIILEAFFISNDAELETFLARLWPVARALAKAIDEGVRK